MANWVRLAVLVNDLRKEIEAKAKAEGKRSPDSFNQAFTEVLSRPEFSIITDWVEARSKIGTEMASWKKKGRKKEKKSVDTSTVPKVTERPETPLFLSIGGVKKIGRKMVTFVARWTSADVSLVISLDWTTIVTLKKDGNAFTVVSVGSLVPGGKPLPHAAMIAKNIAKDLASERISPQKRLFV